MVKYSINLTSLFCPSDRPVSLCVPMMPCVDVSPSESLDKEGERKENERGGDKVEAEEECKAPFSAEDSGFCADRLRFV